MFNKKTIKKILVSFIIVLVSFLLLEFSMHQFNLQDFWQYFNKSDTYFGLYLLSYFILISFYLILLFIINNYFITNCLFVISFFVIAIVNKTKLDFRSEPIFPSDVAFLKNVRSFVTMVETKVLIIFIIGIIILVSSLIYIYKKLVLKYEYKVSDNNHIRLMAILPLILIFISYFRFNYHSAIYKLSYELGFTHNSWNQSMNYKNNTFVLGFAKNLPGPAIHKPDNYSYDSVIEVVKEYTEKANEINETRIKSNFDGINIVYILSESLSDPNRVNGVAVNPTPIPYIQDPTDKRYSGLMLSPVYGGGTPNTEYEVLTSFAKQNLLSNVDNAYSSVIPNFKEFPNFVNVYKNSDNKKAVAIHSYNSTMYKRKTVFDIFGFDEQYYMEDFKHTEKVDNTNYISDYSAYQETLDILKKADSDYFIHLLTMQNHTGYYDNYNDYSFEVTGDLRTEDLEKVKYYSQGLSHTDIATAEFIKEIQEIDSKVIVVLYGDHLPPLYSKLESKNKMLNFGLTDYFIFTNFDVGLDSESRVMSPTHFNSKVLDLLNIKTTGFYTLVDELRSEIPIAKNDLYFDENLNSYLYDELTAKQKKLLDDYHLIQYDIIEGNQYSKDFFKMDGGN